MCFLLLTSSISGIRYLAENLPLTFVMRGFCTPATDTLKTEKHAIQKKIRHFSLGRRKILESQLLTTVNLK